MEKPMSSSWQNWRSTVAWSLLAALRAAEGVDLLLDLVLVVDGLGFFLVLVVLVLEAGNVGVVDLDEGLCAGLGLVGVGDVGDLERKEKKKKVVHGMCSTGSLRSTGWLRKKKDSAQLFEISDRGTFDRASGTTSVISFRLLVWGVKLLRRVDAKTARAFDLKLDRVKNSDASEGGPVPRASDAGSSELRPSLTRKRARGSRDGMEHRRDDRRNSERAAGAMQEPLLLSWAFEAAAVEFASSCILGSDTKSAGAIKAQACARGRPTLSFAALTRVETIEMNKSHLRARRNQNRPCAADAETERGSTMRASEKKAQRINFTVDSWHHRMLRATLVMRLSLTLSTRQKSRA
ncbi:hypothetical protein L1887_56002 [Cichorium endivia]|nr:hypothetical protein L1887_56002 [Cichorium endivia]